MKNVLLAFCRRHNRYASKKVARQLGISVEDYKSIESGEILLTEVQARQLGKLYNAHYSYFYNEALQLDLLRTKTAIIKVLKNQLDVLKERYESASS
jgi:cobalamin biosynthesis protein CbiG